MAIQVKMTVFRDESCTKEDDIMLDLIDVELMKKSGRGLGLSIVGRRNGPGVYISDVVNIINQVYLESTQGLPKTFQRPSSGPPKSVLYNTLKNADEKFNQKKEYKKEYLDS